MHVCDHFHKQRKQRVASDPVPTSPTSSTPEPDTSSVPLDNATIPSAAMQAPTGTDILLSLTCALY